MAEILTPDICVIGAGAGGLSVAAAAAAFGVPVVLIEKGEAGRRCLYTGCVPSKALIAAAKRAHGIAEAEAFGVSAGPATVDFAKVRRHVHDVIAAIAPNDSKERFTGLGVRVIEGGRALQGPRDRRGRRRHRDQGAPLRDCDRIVAVAAAHPRTSTRCRT